MAKLKVDITKHILIPKHTKLSEKERKELLEKFSISVKELPKINKDDSAIEHLEVQAGDVIKIVRKSPTAGEVVFYRGIA